ncbi:MAG: hypothetical protein EXR69_02730 [Myxococcales bacterium]|nr:hypothetical protein [Myxococcales bacterium]
MTGACGPSADGRVGGIPNAYESDWEEPPDGELLTVAVDIGACALDAEGYATCWGAPEAKGLDEVPDAVFEQISVGQGRACGLDAEGAATCWGEIAFPAPADARFRSISSNSFGGCGILLDGTALCCDTGPSEVPAGIYASIVHGWTNACAITVDGRMECWVFDLGGFPSG